MTMLRAICFATTLRDKLHEKLHSVTPPSTERKRQMFDFLVRKLSYEGNPSKRTESVAKQHH